jgi:hypothetical protein
MPFSSDAGNALDAELFAVRIHDEAHAGRFPASTLRLGYQYRRRRRRKFAVH